MWPCCLLDKGMPRESQRGAVANPQEHSTRQEGGIIPITLEMLSPPNEGWSSTARQPSFAGVGQAHGIHTFVGQLTWMPAITLGYLSSIGAHVWINQGGG